MITLRTLAEQLIRKGYTAEQAVVLAKRTYRRDGHGRFSSTGSAPAVRDQSARERNRFPQYAARGSSSKSPSARLYGRLLSKTNTQRMHLDAAVGRHLSERVAETVSRGLRKPRNRVEQLVRRGAQLGYTAERHTKHAAARYEAGDHTGARASVRRVLRARELMQRLTTQLNAITPTKTPSKAPLRRPQSMPGYV